MTNDVLTKLLPLSIRKVKTTFTFHMESKKETNNNDKNDLQVLGGPSRTCSKLSSSHEMATKASILVSSMLRGCLGLRPGVAKMRKSEEHCTTGRLGWTPTCVAHSLPPNASPPPPAIIRGVPPHWMNKPHQELAPALLVVAGYLLIIHKHAFCFPNVISLFFGCRCERVPFSCHQFLFPEDPTETLVIANFCTI